MSRKLVFVLAVGCTLAVGAGVATAGLVGYWPLNEGQGTVTKDMSGKGHDGTITGTTPWVVGAPGFRTALQFGGTGSGVNCGQWNPSTVNDPSGHSVSFTCWVNRIAGGGAYQGIIANRTTYGSDDTTINWALEYNLGANFLQFGSRTGTSYGRGALPVGQWTFLAVTFDGTTVSVYQNAGAASSGGAAFGLDKNSTVRIGCDEGGGGNAFNGLIDDVHMFDHILTTAEIAALMVAPAYQTSDKPSPANNAQDVQRDVVLGWAAAPSAGKHDVYFGTSFADVNTASRQNPGTVLVSQGQDANTYDPPGRLSFGQTYYWRVDEVNASADQTIFKGDVWQFTTEPLYYTVTGVTATASSFTTGSGPENTINGSGLNASNQHAVEPNTMWLTGKGTTLPAWIQYDLGRIRKVETMTVWNYNATFEDIVGIGAMDVKVEYSTDAIAWAQLAGVPKFGQGIGDPTYTANTTVDFGGVAARFVKLTVTSTWGGTTQTGLSEVRFLEMIDFARSPQPASGATGVSPSTTLSWRSGREAASASIYIGTDPNVLTLSGTSPTNSFAPANIGLGIKYYWRVDEVNTTATPSTWAGDVWNFTTPNFLVVDDMESYNDTTSKIFDVWVDGYSTPTTNGAIVGYGTSANGTFGETTTRHAGRQSMPFAYNNASVAISEATRTFATAQDWTVAKADTLRLWVDGRDGDLPTGTLPAATTTFDVTGAGSDIYQATDQFRFVYRQLTGDGSITARVDFQQPTSQYAKAGVMIRSGLTAGGLQTYMATLPGTPNTTTTPMQVEWSFRPTVGDATARSLATTPAPMAPWVRLTRTGDVIKGEYSVDGVTWVSTSITTTPQTIAMGSPVNIGLIVCSHVVGTLGEAKFSNVKTTGNVTGEWQKADIGITTVPAGNTADTFYVTLTDGAGHSKTVIPTVANPVCTTGMWQSVDLPFSQFTGVTMSSVKTMVIGVGDKTNPLHGSGTLYIDDIGVGHPAP